MTDITLPAAAVLCEWRNFLPAVFNEQEVSVSHWKMIYTCQGTELCFICQLYTQSTNKIQQLLCLNAKLLFMSRSRNAADVESVLCMSERPDV